VDTDKTEVCVNGQKRCWLKYEDVNPPTKLENCQHAIDGEDEPGLKWCGAKYLEGGGQSEGEKGE